MRKHLKYLRQQKGLTLVELLAVLVILGIVAAIAVPMIGNIIGNSKVKADVNEAINIINAAKFAEMDGVKMPSTGYTASELGPYLDIDLDGQTFRVTKENKEWFISGHDAYKAFDGKSANDAISEKNLKAKVEYKEQESTGNPDNDPESQDN